MSSPHPLPGSARLALRRFTAADRALLHRLHGDPRVMRYVGGVLDRAASEAMLHERILDYYAQHPGLGVWATLERASGACVGLHLLNHIRDEAHIQVGYLLFPEYWGRGYATEMALAVLRHGFETMRLPQIVGITDRANADSQRVLLKIGLQRRGERSLAHPAYAKQGPLAWFERDAADWLAERVPQAAAARS